MALQIRSTHGEGGGLVKRALVPYVKNEVGVIDSAKRDCVCRLYDIARGKSGTVVNQRDRDMVSEQHRRKQHRGMHGVHQ